MTDSLPSLKNAPPTFSSLTLQKSDRPPPSSSPFLLLVGHRRPSQRRCAFPSSAVHPLRSGEPAASFPGGDDTNSGGESHRWWGRPRLQILVFPSLLLRFPANQRRPTTAGPVFLFLNSGEALFFILYLSFFVFHCFVRGSELEFDFWDYK